MRVLASDSERAEGERVEAQTGVPDQLATPSLPVDAVLRTGSGESQEAARPEVARSDAPVVAKPGPKPRPEDKASVRPAGTDARKLMLEDGLAQPQVPAAEPKGFGEFDMDM